ncbi:TIGR01620 family protein [Fulvimarina sp. MAC3]|uniref:YcjF family protein n=1 Tax=Fulvimarina sp. MAC3 TaxID=3148887 RepID=UPI0031FC77C9
MSPNEPPSRRPQSFRLPDDSREQRTRTRDEERPGRAPRAINQIEMLEYEPDEAIDEDLAETMPPVATRTRKRFSFGKIAVGALGALISLGIGLWIDSLVRDLFARYDWLGWTALAAAGLFVLAVIGIVIRETLGLMRLSAVEKDRRESQAAFHANSREGAEQAVRRLSSIVSSRPETLSGRTKLADMKDEVVDGADLIRIAERDILGPLDAQAVALVLATSKRTSVVTAVSPKALVDVAYVLFESVKLIRRMSELYGARPGALGLIRLTRDVVAHLAVTGSIAIGDDLVGQMLGHGIAAKLSARLGEGIVNGLLTARIGLAAMDLCRPFPFMTTERPKLRDVLGELTRFASRQQSKRNREG